MVQCTYCVVLLHGCLLQDPWGQRNLLFLFYSCKSLENLSWKTTLCLRPIEVQFYISIVIANPVVAISKPGYVFSKCFLNGMFLNNIAWVDHLRYFDLLDTRTFLCIVLFCWWWLNCFACGWSVWSLAKRNIVNCFRTERPSTKITTSQLTSESTSLPSTPAATTTATGNYISIVLASPVGVITKPGYVFSTGFLNGVSEQRSARWPSGVLWHTWHENSPLYCTVLLVVIIKCFACRWSVWSLAKRNIVNCFRTERPSTEITTSQLTSELTSLPSTSATITTATGTKSVLIVLYFCFAYISVFKHTW